MSLPRDTERDPHADALLTSALHAADGVEADGCPDAEVIGLYAERVLAGAELRAIEAHVHTCPRCQATVAAFVRTLPDGATDAAGAADGVSAGGGFAAWFAGWRWLVPATGLAAVALVAVWVGRGPADQVAESARGAAGVVAEGDAPAAQPAAPFAAPREPAEFVRRVAPDDAAVNRPLERVLPTTTPTPQAVERAAEVTSARGAGAAGADTRAKSAAPEIEARRQAVGQLADSAIANESVRAVSPDTRAAATGAARESAAAVAAPAPAPAPLQETIAVSPAPPAAARTATFSALAFSPWRAVDGRVERSRDNGGTWERVPTPEGVRVIAAGSSGGDICWIVAEDGVLRTTDGRTWIRTTRPTREPLAAIVPMSAERASVFTASGARWETSNGGRTWAPAP